METEKAEVEIDREQTLNELREGKKEQEDLLVLLADQDTKLKDYRKKLKELGEKVLNYRIMSSDKIKRLLAVISVIQ